MLKLRSKRTIIFCQRDCSKRSSAAYSASSMSTIKFCQDCSNLLYPREDSEKKILVYGCHHCSYEEPAQSTTVYYKELNRTGSQRKPILNIDPILPRTKSVRCPHCKHQEATFFQAPMPDETDGEELALVFVCCNPKCGHRWRS